tara:strand:+ start:374 stop:553 length:180 start_codon:yes stop_codon:yes gene_type:complete
MNYCKTINLNPTAAAVYRANEQQKQQQQQRTALNVWRDAAIRDTISRKNHKLGSLGDLI